ncbi:hypothetical protein [Staphylococcus felis]|nr:hypothetical protein [Staphylococcus felis]QQB03727.1 hypothetical protein I6H71_01840 [Staphylococcus felis]
MTREVDVLLNKYLIDNHNEFDKSIILFPFAGGGCNIHILSVEKRIK